MLIAEKMQENTRTTPLTHSHTTAADTARVGEEQRKHRDRLCSYSAHADECGRHTHTFQHKQHEQRTVTHGRREVYTPTETGEEAQRQHRQRLHASDLRTQSQKEIDSTQEEKEEHKESTTATPLIDNAKTKHTPQPQTHIEG